MSRARVLVIALLAAGCGSSSTSPTPPAQPPQPSITSVAVTGTPPGVGLTTQFTSTVTKSDGTASNVTVQSTWTTSNPSIATVSISGNVTGVAVGNVDITANYMGVNGVAHVAIPAAPTYTVFGTITDGKSGGVLPNVTVQVTDAKGIMHATTTDASGKYSISGLPTGITTITASAASAISYGVVVRILTLTADLQVDIVLPRA